MTLHVTNGESAAGSLRETDLGGAVLSWEDVLSEGPVPLVSESELRQVRSRFLHEAGWGSLEHITAAFEARDATLHGALAEGDAVVLWFEHDLFDQLQLAQVLSMIGAADAGGASIELLNVGAVDGRPDFHGLGELTPAELEALWPRRRPLEPAVVALGQAAWDAFRSPTPVELDALRREGTSALPFLHAAVERLLEELPAVGTGLARSERAVLEVLAEGEATRAEIFVATQAGEEAPYDGDAWVYARIAALGGGPHPLLEPIGEESRLRLTGDGRDVLEGRADRVERIGLDRWLGGAHLGPEGRWRWDRAARAVVAPG